MGSVESAGYLGEDRERSLGRELALALEDRLQVAPLDVAHRQVELAVPLARLVDRDDVWVVERRREPRLLQKAGSEAFVLGQLGRDQLQSHWALERQIGRPVNDAHAAPADE